VRVEPRAEQSGAWHRRDPGGAAEELEGAEHGVDDLGEGEDRQAEVDAAELQGDSAEGPREERGHDATRHEPDPRTDRQLRREQGGRVAAEGDVPGVAE
jgi:hypothetical protein